MEKILVCVLVVLLLFALPTAPRSETVFFEEELSVSPSPATGPNPEPPRCRSGGGFRCFSPGIGNGRDPQGQERPVPVVPVEPRGRGRRTVDGGARVHGAPIPGLSPPGAKRLRVGRGGKSLGHLARGPCPGKALVSPCAQVPPRDPEDRSGPPSFHYPLRPKDRNAGSGLSNLLRIEKPRRHLFRSLDHRGPSDQGAAKGFPWESLSSREPGKEKPCGEGRGTGWCPWKR